uniref:Uncharacterized protein n=1 Tax=Mycobacterium riyadhense TaxID=486698 RepID=A0A653F1J7_9MYCO|nr:hypothetical protein BIN_B_05111 [Mycobacterium riyadhense]
MVSRRRPSVSALISPSALSLVTIVSINRPALCSAWMPTGKCDRLRNSGERKVTDPVPKASLPLKPPAGKFSNARTVSNSSPKPAKVRICE